MKQVCPLCAIDDDVDAVPLGAGLFEYTCRNVRKHPGSAPFGWQGTAEGKLTGEASGEGLMHELDMLNQLTGCFSPGEGWLEYGIVEDRYRKQDPEAFEELRQQFGHRTLGPQKSRNFTMSAYIARVLGMLRDENQLAFTYGKATGTWSYNGSISYWALPPAPPLTEMTTFEEYESRSSGS